jgi:uncharacterized protein (DUF2236 family)
MLLMAVTREQLELQLSRLRARVKDPRHGLFGPHSMVWRVNREQLMFMAGGRAALLQEAHPFVAHGVDQHSLTRSDPAGRFARTFRNVYAMVFGDLESALGAARRVHSIHTHIHGEIAEPSGAHPHGSRYDANEEHALLWVHATLWESSLFVYELLMRPLSSADKERYYQETKLFAYLFGISDEVLPASYRDFMAYNRRMWHSNELFVGTPAREMAGFLLAAQRPGFETTMAWYRVITAGMLPAPLREAYELPFGRSERVLYRASVRALRAAVPLIPRQLRYIPAYLQARERIGRPIEPTLAERFFTGRLLPAVRGRAA